jgi:thiol-disulfide isomerase/thioredoxin
MKRALLPIVAFTMFGAAALSGVLGWVAQFAIVGCVYLFGGFLVARGGTWKQAIFHGSFVVAPWVAMALVVAFRARLSHVYPIVLVGPLACALGVVGGRLYMSRPRAASFALAPALAFLAIGSFVGMPNWLNLTLYSKYYLLDTEYPAPSFSFRLPTGEQVTHESLRGKVVVLDFWTTSCASCFASFPKLEKLYDRYRSDPAVEVFAVNLPLERDAQGQAQAMIAAGDYRFPSLFASAEAEIAEGFRIRSVPTALVIDRQGVVRFHGGLDAGRHIVIGNVQRAVERARMRPG